MKNKKWRESNFIKKITSLNFYGVLRSVLLASLIVMLIILAVFQYKANPTTLLYFIIVEGLLLCSNILKLYVLQKSPVKFLLYVLDYLLILSLLALSRISYIITLYILILSEYYYSATSKHSRAIMGFVSFASYVLCYVLVKCLLGDFDTSDLITQMLNDFIVFVLHFTIFNLAVALYRRNKLIEKNLGELKESSIKLQSAYEKLEEVTVLEERNRISNEIHDVVGHSITTVIMQTEAAKLLIDKDPKEAKAKIVYANMLAKSALQELRNSVHNLSGRTKDQTLKMALENILNSFGVSCEVNVRYDIDEFELEDEKERYIITMLKEGLSNGLRHGKSTAFYYELKKNKNEIDITLSDNGVGAKDGIIEGFGLTKIKEKATAFGGKAEFSSETDEGFEIKIKLPIENDKEL